MSDGAADHLRLRADKTVVWFQRTARAHNRVTRDRAVRNAALRALVMPNSGVVVLHGYPPVHISQWPVTTATTPSTTSGRVEEGRDSAERQAFQARLCTDLTRLLVLPCDGVLTAKIAANDPLAEVAAAIGHE